ncbi:MAG: bifunctional phosphoribosylaminoimidazolecarboxamide formyltransferase/IMP cyclohydrolase [Gemmatimonadaceae bacterium]|nr:bifunctional phosphoribosylaminoimidazolecarboxamide formyltransferase/IMP cyclohydrolase [Gemmatimonadaceae bacterium]NUQ93398.1 bifunctional phosphoribosylaminoimidazolecarboxamide formyltransferase/IMP cyclohydrolase [Gemmatimonadaceae bacterium]NUR20439.1 bifunctional phosphoribosylaminoimidazolecarboxamide formyltransferase/IMP cyclohydrolase [Gemmatimonadaceae bacterium]NUS96083.1 bifunctional phosphoribosylaminoimidazolecarboxamide formyltransferase/IMP cyclohydrolase [Gemmatimonadacea
MRALLSVSDKTGLVDFARGLADLGWELVSTGGTARSIRDAGIAVRDVSDVTGFPEMMDGRVKTLHPVVHGGLLARRDLPEHVAAMKEHGIEPIDLVAVNLYPFRETAARKGVSPEEVVENIDIGGPSMLRSAAKNFAAVTVVVDPADYGRVLSALKEGGDALAFRRELAEKAYAHTAAYDAAISGWFAAQRGDSFPNEMSVALRRAQSLRYGENPGQRAAFYMEHAGSGLAALTQRGGKELSFNNLLDLDGALLAADPFRGEPCCAIIKHTTPCGLATGDSALDAYRKALACDPVSAFGSVIAFTVPVDDAAAEAVSSLFVECVVAPSFSEGAVEILGRKKNLRVLEGDARWSPGALDFKRVRGGFLAQERAPLPSVTENWKVVTERQPTDAERADLAFAWRAVAGVKSNAIVLARNGATIGIGAGQMSRVDAAFVAVHKARTIGHDTKGSALGSDAFFPFRDGIDQAAEAGVTAIVQPGGSVRDQEVIDAANHHGMTMVLTGQRLFRH